MLTIIPFRSPVGCAVHTSFRTLWCAQHTLHLLMMGGSGKRSLGPQSRYVAIGSPLRIPACAGMTSPLGGRGCRWPMLSRRGYAWGYWDGYWGQADGIRPEFFLLFRAHLTYFAPRLSMMMSPGFPLAPRRGLQDHAGHPAGMALPCRYEPATEKPWVTRSGPRSEGGKTQRNVSCAPNSGEEQRLGDRQRADSRKG
jgi:hypothetical protein